MLSINLTHGAHTLSAGLKQFIDRELDSGEIITWLEKPIPYYWTNKSLGSFLFAIPWTAFSIFWMYAVMEFRIPDVSDIDINRGAAVLFGTPFVLVGLVLLLNPIWTYRKTLASVYVITNKRAITIEGGWSTTIRSYFPNELTDLFRRERRDGSGDVVIVRPGRQDAKGDQQTNDLGFLRIRNPKHVEGLLISLRNKTARQTAIQ